MSRATGQGGIDYQDGGFVSGGPVYPMVKDLAELAARMNSLVTYDRAGNVIWMTDFEHGIHVLKSSEVGTGAEQITSAVTSVSGGYCLKMVTSTSANQVQSATRSIFIPNATTRMGLEAAFAIPASEVEVGISIIIYDGSDSYEYSLTYRSDEDRLYITSPTGAGTLKSNFSIREGAWSWHVMKIVGDFDENAYVRAFFDTDEFDVSDYAGWHQTSSEAIRIDIRLKGASREDASKIIYWDNVIVTQNEPEPR